MVVIIMCADILTERNSVEEKNMPTGKDELRMLRLKQARLNPKNSKAAALREAGFAESTAHSRAADCKALKIVDEEIKNEIRKKITVEYVLGELERIKKLAEKDKDFSTATRDVELLGKFLAMFTEKTEITQVEEEENQFAVSRVVAMQR